MRGPKKHLKRLFAPKDWMLSKLAGVFAPRPRAGPHKLRESLPLIVILRNRLKYALNAREAQMIMRQKLVNVDSRPRTDVKYPAGFMDVVEIPKSGDRFRLLYDVKGRFTFTKIGEAEAAIKLCKVENVLTTTSRTPMVVTHDGRRFRFPDPKIRRGDTIVVNHRDSKIVDHIPMKAGRVVMITGGANRGRVGTVTTTEKHPGAFDICRIKDANGAEFATRTRNVFVIGAEPSKVQIALPKAQGIKPDVIVEREQRLIAAEQRKQKQAAAARKIRK